MITREGLEAYLTSYVDELAFGDEEPGAVIDRYHTPDLEWRNDGRLLDRESLIAHARPARRNVRSCTVDVHEALVDDDRVAARYTLRAELRKGAMTTEIHMFGLVAPDGRLRRIDQLTRTLPAE
jgi:hypothetical protein